MNSINNIISFIFLWC